MGKGRIRFSLWNVIGIAALVVLCVTTFQPAIMATIVHPDIGGNIFAIASYVGSLAGVYAPWLPLMMSEATGARTALLLNVGTVVLYALCVASVLAIALVVASIVLNILGRRKAARVVGIVGFALGLLVPLASIAIVGVVQFEMSSDLISIAVLDVGSACYLQLAACVVGIVGTVLATHRIADPKTQHSDQAAVPAQDVAATGSEG